MIHPIALPRNIMLLGLSAIALVSVGACSSDSKTVSPTLPPGLSIPSDLSVPTSGDCVSVYMKFVTAMTSAYIPNTPVDYGTAFADVAAVIPSDLQDDLVIMSDAYQHYGEILAANNNDASSPAVQEAVQALATDEVNTAGNNLQDYFEQTCPGIA